MIYFLVFFVSDADGQKRKKSLRRKLDSLAKEKSKDKGMPSFSKVLSDIVPVHRVFSPSSLSAFLCLDSNISPSPLLRQRARAWSPTVSIVRGLSLRLSHSAAPRSPHRKGAGGAMKWASFCQMCEGVGADPGFCLQ